MPEDRYDYIIAGAGASGLSLVYHLVTEGLSDKKILLIDRGPKKANDRTWCFWEVGDSPFESVVYRKWNQIWFHGDGVSRRSDISPYAYKMIRGIDFYLFMDEWLARQPNITLMHGEITSIEEGEQAATVWVDGNSYQGHFVFNSLYKAPVLETGQHHLLQHFKGWVVGTTQPVFDTSAATFMDFRVEQHDEVRFVYVLPFDEYTALVEYTLFSSAVLPDAEYDMGLREYIERFLGLGEFRILETEFGIIPMTNAPFQLRPSPHVVNIGMAGGRTKASTGFTFQRIQHHSRQIVNALLQTGQPTYPEPLFNRFEWYDSILLNVLDKRRTSGKAVFSDLFRKNSPQRVLKFLDEDTSLLEDVQVTLSVDKAAFIRAAMDLGFAKLLRGKPRASKLDRG